MTAHKLATKLRLAGNRDKMRAAGYYSAAEIAEKMQLHVNSVYRWVSEGEVESTRIAGKSYISRASLVRKIGDDAARIFGFTAPAVAVEVEDE